jgi:hypothetical protein
MLLPIENDQTARSREYRSLLTSFESLNAFNPSFQQHEGRLHIVFRHLGGERRPPFHASVLTVDLLSGVHERLDLTEHLSNFGVGVVADPKLVLLDEQLWVTFNDGWSATHNRIYLMRLSPSPGRPIECVLANRQPVEKNWAFFNENGLLKVIYSIDPLCILTAPLPVESSDTLRLEHDSSSDEFGDAPGRSTIGLTLGLTIGTQAVQRNGDLYLVAHEKWQLARWRAYVGRWVRVRRDTGRYEVEVSRKRLCHSYRSLFGTRKKFNKNLFSCTYFSGLMIEGNKVMLGYGINDVGLGFSELDIHAL